MGSAPQSIEVREEDARAALRFAQIIEWSPEDDAFVVSVPDIPDLHTHGATREEAYYTMFGGTADRSSR